MTDQSPATSVAKAEISYDSLPTVVADPDDLTQVFEALLTNAIMFKSAEPPRIALSAERDGTLWEVSVRDNGIGIEPDQTDRIFGVFQRIHTDEAHSGSGIGLAICKRLIERQGEGKIWVDSTPGEGSTLHFTLVAQGSGGAGPEDPSPQSMRERCEA